MRTTNFCSLLLGFVLFSLSALAQADGLAALGVSPTRVVLSETNRNAALTLRNSSSETFSYRMKFLEMGIAANGDLVELDELPEGYRSAAGLLRFSPRQVRLGPGQSQVIRLLSRRGAAVEAGEYRSHLEIRALPDVTRQDPGALFDEEGQPMLRPSVISRVGVTLPVIFRQGQTQAEANFENVRLLQNDEGMLDGVELTLTRRGTQSVFGSISVYLLASGEKPSTESLIAKIEGYGFFHPHTQERLHLKIKPFSAELLNSKDQLHVRFWNDERGAEKKLWFDAGLAWTLEERR